MDSLGIALLMLLAVVASGAAVRVLPAALPLPLPLVQIALGALIAAFTQHGVRLEPDLFFFLFLPPLLFLDGWRIPKDGLFRDRGIILQLALGLVVFTVLGLGFFIHALIPSMPLPVAFALAAVVSPTDPVAVSAITERVAMPRRLLHILEGESLLNDASGLVAFRFAVAAAASGAFSLHEAALSFAWVAAGGVAVGTGFTWLVTNAKSAFSRRWGEEPGSEILISLLIPFGAYALAEKAGTSGILAAVAAGVAMSYAELRGTTLAVTRVQRTAVWNTLQFTLNGVMFVLLGEQLPDLLHGAVRVVTEAGHANPWWLLVYTLAINVALAALRFVWVWTSMQMALWRSRRRGHVLRRAPPRLTLAVSLAGVRGAVTLAAVLTLPEMLREGVPLPARDLAIFLAASVIVVSLLLASATLPRVLSGLHFPPETEHHSQEDLAMRASREAAAQAVERTLREVIDAEPDADPQPYTDIASRLMEVVGPRAGDETGRPDDADQRRKEGEVAARMRQAALRAARDELFRLARERRISDEVAREAVRRLDMQEARGPRT